MHWQLSLHSTLLRQLILVILSSEWVDETNCNKHSTAITPLGVEPPLPITNRDQAHLKIRYRQ